MPNFKLKGLPKQVANSAQIYQIISYIDNSYSNKRSIEASNRAGVKSHIEKIELPEIMQYFFGEKISWEDLGNLKQELLEIIKTAPVVTLTLSSIPSSSVRTKFVAWFRAISPVVLVEIIVDESIMGGVIVKTERRKLDFSISSVLPLGKKSLKEVVDNV